MRFYKKKLLVKKRTFITAQPNEQFPNNCWQAEVCYGEIYEMAEDIQDPAGDLMTLYGHDFDGNKKTIVTSKSGIFWKLVNGSEELILF